MRINNQTKFLRLSPNFNDFTLKEIEEAKDYLDKPFEITPLPDLPPITINIERLY